MLFVTPRIQIPFDEFEFTYVRSSGPGGQNVNKVNSKAVLRWPLTVSPSLPADVRARFLARFHNKVTGDGELVISSQRYRDQGRNNQDCLDKVKEMLLEVAKAPTVRRATKPSKGSKVRRLASKKIRSSTKQGRRDKPTGDDE